MTAYNVVRNRVKPGREQDFENAYRNLERTFPGMRKVALIKTGERSYCIIGEWDSMDSIAAARPEMIKTLDTIREMLEDLGGGLGVTDPVSGEAVVEIGGAK
jgi:antibiotic biosynthesis monooxygenase (ABM) superfamily enzyme